MRRAIVVVSYSVLWVRTGEGRFGESGVFLVSTFESSRCDIEPKNLVHTFVKIFTFARDILPFFHVAPLSSARAAV